MKRQTAGHSADLHSHLSNLDFYSFSPNSFPFFSLRRFSKSSKIFTKFKSSKFETRPFLDLDLSRKSFFSTFFVSILSFFFALYSRVLIVWAKETSVVRPILLDISGEKGKLVKTFFCEEKVMTKF